MIKIDFPLAVLSQAELISNRCLVPVPPFIPEIPCSIEDPLFDQYWRIVRDWTYLDVYKAKSVWDLAMETADLEGDFIECGCHLGGLGFLLAFLIRHHGFKKKVFLCDSFQGMPEPDPVVDTFYRKGMLKSDLERCRDFIASHDLQSTAVVLPGWFEDTLPAFEDRQRFSLVHIDCDIYQSTLTCFENLYSKAAASAPIIMDDFYIPPAGERTAAMQWISQTEETLQIGPLSQVYFRKGVSVRDADKWIVEDCDGIALSVKELAQNKAYLAFLRGVQERLLQESENLARLRGVLESS